jgi:site-specific DNA-methyltransferase (adenine-specific)
MNYQLHHGDCLEVMATMADNSVDAIVTDPPYGLSFMGKNWDHGVPGEAFWREALRVAKPGAHLLAFGGTRTFHRLAVAIEDAGWEIRDTIGMPHESGEWGDCPWLLAWVYGSGFPKSLDVPKAIDKAAGAEREVVGVHHRHGGGSTKSGSMSGGELGTASELPLTAPATDAARQWSGWGTALKPAWEPIIVARKPLVGTVAENVLTHGTGAINVDGCRVRMSDEDAEFILKTARPNTAGKHHCGNVMNRPVSPTVNVSPAGRWPANLIHDGSEEVVGLFPVTTSGSRKQGTYRGTSGSDSIGNYGLFDSAEINGDSGSAARFFYCAKASKVDRGEGNTHPTVKPTDLMRYLCRLVTPPGGIVLDPFMGSGSTGKAAILEGFQFIGIEREAEYLAIAEARISHASGLSQPPQRPTRQPAPACPGQLALF